MSELNKTRFEMLLIYVHNHPSGKYTLIDNAGLSVDAMYETDYESDNGLDEEEAGYEEYHCIAFKRVSDGTFFEVNHHKIPVCASCDGITIY